MMVKRGENLGDVPTIWAYLCTYFLPGCIFTSGDLDIGIGYGNRGI
jgi:hypothetical protein